MSRGRPLRPPAASPPPAASRSPAASPPPAASRPPAASPPPAAPPAPGRPRGAPRAAAPRRLWWVYVARCGDGTLYTGVTTDLARRLAEHAAGRGARYTRGRGGDRLRCHYYEAAASQGAALRREAALKRLPRARKLALANPPGFRPASPADLPFLRRTIAALDLDPERVAHEQFTIATVGRARAGFVRVKPYARCFELGSLAVLPAFRGHGLGAALVRFMAARFPTGRVWITTDLVDFFTPLGFRPATAPAELRRKLAGVTHVVRRTGIVALVASRPRRDQRCTPRRGALRR